MIRPFFQYNDSVHSTSKRLDGGSQIRSMWQRYERLLITQALRISQWYLEALLCLLSQFLKYN